MNALMQGTKGERFSGSKIATTNCPFSNLEEEEKNKAMLT